VQHLLISRLKVIRKDAPRLMLLSAIFGENAKDVFQALLQTISIYS